MRYIFCIEIERIPNPYELIDTDASWVFEIIGIEGISHFYRIRQYHRESSVHRGYWISDSRPLYPLTTDIGMPREYEYPRELWGISEYISDTIVSGRIYTRTHLIAISSEHSRGPYIEEDYQCKKYCPSNNDIMHISLVYISDRGEKEHTLRYHDQSCPLLWFSISLPKGYICYHPLTDTLRGHRALTDREYEGASTHKDEIGEELFL